MTSQDDVGMLWYGVSGVPFNPADPSEVMLNAGANAPLLSDQPRSLLGPECSLTYQAQPHQGMYADHTIAPQTTMLYDPNTGDYINQAEYIYESYEGYDEDSCGANQLGTPASVNPEDSPNFNSEDDGSQSSKTKKPKVHQHPLLKLKTPIAYRKDTDLDAIPIMKEGMAVCEVCGAIGVKHAFYGKERKFCSLVCARGGDNGRVINACTEDNQADFVNTTTNVNEQENNPGSIVPTEETAKFKSEKYCAPVSPNMTVPRATPLHLPQDYYSSESVGFDWSATHLHSENFTAAPVHYFKHAPMSDGWEAISPGMKVEVSCNEESTTPNAFWVASVTCIFGYLGKLRYEGFEDDSSKDFWMNLCSSEVHPVGWCARQGQALIPPRSVGGKCRDWKDFLKKRLSGARTLPTNFHTRVTDSQKSRFRPGLHLEVVDKNRIAQMRVATVTAVVGKRIHLRYHGASSDDNGFWCHEDSPLIHPVGWSREIGHEIVASQSYHEKCMQGLYDSNDSTPDLFLAPSIAQTSVLLNFTEGMKLEALDPLNLSSICVATIMKVLRQNYLMIRIDSYATDDTGSDWFCYHASSPYIFAPGFCKSNNLLLHTPKRYQKEFSWKNYVNDTQSVMAPPELFEQRYVCPTFEPGMYLEAADLMDPRLICVARVKQVKNSLLKIHFDGWDDEFDQWVDSASSDIYPVGWCSQVGYQLEGPRQEPVQSQPRKKTKGRIGKKTRSTAMRSFGNRGVENDSPAFGTNEMSTKTESEECHLGLQAHSVSTENLGDIVKKSSNVRGNGKRSQKTPLGTCNQTVHGALSSVRSTRMLSHYNNSDEEDVSDDTSSGIVSLVGSEGAWDDDASSQQVIDAPMDTRTHDTTSLQRQDQDPQGLEFRQSNMPTFSEADLLCSDMFGSTNTQPTHCVENEHANTTLMKQETRSNLYIPRIVDNTADLKASEIFPKQWSPTDVSAFLQINDCGSYGANFIEKNIDGAKLLTLAQNDLMNLTRMKVGPSLKVHALIQQLLAIIHPAKARYQATMMKRGMTFNKS